MKIGQYLVKLSARVRCLVFFDSRCIYITTRISHTAYHKCCLHLDVKCRYSNVPFLVVYSYSAFSALMLLVGQVGRQQGHQTFKKLEWWSAGMVICLERGADLHTAQLMPQPLTVSCFSKIHIGFTFLVPDHPAFLVLDKGP